MGADKCPRLRSNRNGGSVFHATDFDYLRTKVAAGVYMGFRKGGNGRITYGGGGRVFFNFFFFFFFVF